MILMIIHLILFTISFFLVWFASRLVVKNLERFSSKIHLSPFAASFFILGILTSLPELAIGVNAVWAGQPSIFAGNLIGASFVLLVLIVPFVALVSGGIDLKHQLTPGALILSLIVIIAPVFFTLDGAVDRPEAAALMVLYGALVFVIEKRKNFPQALYDSLFGRRADGWFHLLKIIIGAGLIFAASNILVTQTIYFSELFQISSFIISLVVLSIGTNTPELFIGIAAVIRRKKEMALADYIGSAAFNSFIFGFLTLVYGPFTLMVQGFRMTFLLFFAGLTIFFIFMRSKRHLSRWESLIILCLYFIFLFLQVFGQT